MSSIILQDSRSQETTSLSGAIQTSQPISGGLWTPTGFPQFSNYDLATMQGLTYQSLADAVLGTVNKL